LILLSALFLLAPLISPYKYYEQNLKNRLSPPSHKHILGTDHLGRDIFSRILQGGRLSFLIATLGVLFSSVIGVLVGSISGFYGGTLDEILMRTSDLFLSIPTFVISIAIISLTEGSLSSLVLILALTNWPKYAKLARALTMEIKSKDFIDLVSLTGARSTYIITTHIIPNYIGPILALASFDFGKKVVWIANIGFLGIGIKPPLPEWGSMLKDSLPYILSFPHLALSPTIMVVITLIASNTLGEGLAETLYKRREIRI